MGSLYVLNPNHDPDLSGRPMRMCHCIICDWVISVPGYKKRTYNGCGGSRKTRNLS